MNNSRLHEFKFYPLVVQLEKLNRVAQTERLDPMQARELLETTILALSQYVFNVNCESKNWIPVDDSKCTLFEIISNLVDALAFKLVPLVYTGAENLQWKLPELGTLSTPCDIDLSVRPNHVMPELDEFNQEKEEIRNLYPHQYVESLNHGADILLPVGTSAEEFRVQPRAHYSRLTDIRDPNTAKKKRVRSNHPKKCTQVMLDWLNNNLAHPYPSTETKLEFAAKTGLSLGQINNWFINCTKN